MKYLQESRMKQRRIICGQISSVSFDLRSETIRSELEWFTGAPLGHPAASVPPGQGPDALNAEGGPTVCVRGSHSDSQDFENLC